MFRRCIAATPRPRRGHSAETDARLRFLAACVIAETLRLPLPDDWKPSDAAALVRRSAVVAGSSDAKLRKKYGDAWDPGHLTDAEAARLRAAAREAVAARHESWHGD